MSNIMQSRMLVSLATLRPARYTLKKSRPIPRNQLKARDQREIATRLKLLLSLIIDDSLDGKSGVATTEAEDALDK